MVAVAMSARGRDEGGEAFDELEWGEAQERQSQPCRCSSVGRATDS